MIIEFNTHIPRTLSMNLKLIVIVTLSTWWIFLWLLLNLLYNCWLFYHCAFSFIFFSLKICVRSHTMFQFWERPTTWSSNFSIKDLFNIYSHYLLWLSISWCWSIWVISWISNCLVSLYLLRNRRFNLYKFTVSFFVNVYMRYFLFIINRQLNVWWLRCWLRNLTLILLLLLL